MVPKYKKRIEESFIARKKTDKQRFKDFSDEEMYILYRQCIHSSVYLMMTDKYADYQKSIHNDLMNEILDEHILRDKARYRNE